MDDDKLVKFPCKQSRKLPVSHNQKNWLNCYLVYFIGQCLWPPGTLGSAPLPLTYSTDTLAVYDIYGPLPRRSIP